MRERASIVVTGVGVVSPHGNNPQELWEKLLQGRSAIDELRRFDTSLISTSRGAEAGSSVEAESSMGRSDSLGSLWAGKVARAATEQAGLSAAGLDPERGGVCFGTVLATRPGLESRVGPEAVGGDDPTSSSWALPQGPSRTAASWMGFEGPNCVIATACAAGNSAIAYGMEALRSDRADVMVVGGVDEISQGNLMVFDSFRALAPDCVRPFDAERRGLLLGEGAAALVLEREDDARSRRAAVLGRVLGCANVGDGHHMTAPHPAGKGAAQAMSEALAEADLGPAEVGHISAHGTGTRVNDVVEALAIRSVFGHHADEVPVTALKSMLGHSQGAASAIEAIACLWSIQDGLVPVTANYQNPDPECDLDVVHGEARRQRANTTALSNAFGFGGNIECLVLGAA